MRRSVIFLAVLVMVVGCATASQRGQDLVGRSVQAMGGAEALGGVKTVMVKGTVRQWEPEQSMMAGGDMRLACDSTFEAVMDTGTRAARVDWVRNFVYPSTRTFTFSEIVTPEAGYVAGIDSNGRTKQSMDSNPPAHSMSGLRLATTQRELTRMSSLLFIDMMKNPDRVSATGDTTIGGVAYPTVQYRAGDQAFTVMFDRSTGLPARVRTLDYDNIWGDATYDMVLDDWRTVDGIKVAFHRKYELNGRPIMEVKLTEGKFNAPVAADRLTIPAAFKAAASKPATGLVPYQWVIRRQFIGTYLDSDNVSFDTRGSSGLRLVELAPGVQHVVGGSHHSMVVEMRDYLVLFDSPVTDAHSNVVRRLLREKFGNKPVKFLVLSHHHMDHAGGLRVYVAEGATLVVGKGNAEHFRRVLAASFTRNPDLPGRDLKSTTIVEVTDKWVTTDGTREVQAYLIENPHAGGYLIGYVPEPRIGFVVDVWSPGAGPLPDKLTPPLAALVTGVKKAGIQPAKFAGGHGGVADYAPLAALEGK